MNPFICSTCCEALLPRWASIYSFLWSLTNSSRQLQWGRQFPLSCSCEPSYLHYHGGWHLSPPHNNPQWGSCAGLMTRIGRPLFPTTEDHYLQRFWHLTLGLFTFPWILIYCFYLSWVQCHELLPCRAESSIRVSDPFFGSPRTAEYMSVLKEDTLTHDTDRNLGHSTLRNIFNYTILRDREDDSRVWHKSWWQSINDWVGLFLGNNQ